MEIKESLENGVMVISPVGRIDSVSSGELEIKILNFIDQGQIKLAIDLAEVDFVSSAGLRVFLMTAKKLKPLDGKVVLSGIIPEVREVFDISGFATMFSIRPTVAEAVAEFG